MCGEVLDCEKTLVARAGKGKEIKVNGFVPFNFSFVWCPSSCHDLFKKSEVN